MGFDCFMVVLWWVFVVVLRWVFVVMRSDLWAGGAMVLWFVVGRRPLWFRGCEIGFLGWWGDGVVVCGGVTAVVDSWWS